MASALTIQRGRVADFLVENNYRLTALEFHQELLLEGSASDVPKLAGLLAEIDQQLADKQEPAGPAIAPDELDASGVRQLDRLVAQYLRQRGFTLAAMAMEDQAGPAALDEPAGPDEPTLLPLYQFAIDVYHEMKQRDSLEPPEPDQPPPEPEPAPPEPEPELEPEPVAKPAAEPEPLDVQRLRKLEAENLALRAQLEQAGPAGGREAAGQADLYAVVEVLGEQLPQVVPSVLISKREPLVPILLQCIGLHEQHAKRDEMTSLLFNLIKRPDPAQRELILNGCVALAERTSHEARIETELVPQLWEELSHKHPERRALVAHAVGRLACYVKPALRGSLLMSMLRQMAEEEREAEVRMAIVDNCAVLVGELLELDQPDKIREVTELALGLACDSNPEVCGRSLAALLPVICAWAGRHTLVASVLMPSIAKQLDAAHQRYSDRNEASPLCKLLAVFAGCLDAFRGEMLRTAPWAELGQTAGQLQERFDRFIAEGDDTKWLGWEFLFEQCTPQLMNLAPSRAISTPATRELGYALSMAFQQIGQAMGTAYVRDVLRPQFAVLMDQQPAEGSTYRSRLFPVLLAGVTPVLGQEELETALVSGYEDGAMHRNGWGADAGQVLVESTHDLCRLGHTQLILTILIDLIGSEAGKVRLLVAELMGTVLPFSGQKLVEARLEPAVLVLADDQDRDVKLRAIRTMGLLAERIPDGDTAGLKRVLDQLDKLLCEGSREVSIEIIRVFADVIVKAQSTGLVEFVLSKLMEQAEQNTSNRGLQQRPEFATALYEAYRSFDTIVLSDEQTQNKLIPGLKWLTQPEPGREDEASLLGPYEQELMIKTIKNLTPEEERKRSFFDEMFD